MKKKKTASTVVRHEPLILGSMLMRSGLLTRDQLRIGLREHRRQRDRHLGEICVDLGFITHEELAVVLNRQRILRQSDKERDAYLAGVMRQATNSFHGMAVRLDQFMSFAEHALDCECGCGQGCKAVS